MRLLPSMLALLFQTTGLLHLVAAQTAPECTNGQTRLVPGTNNRGLVQYCSSGVWRILCADGTNWRNNEARVVCRQLGYRSGLGSAVTSCTPTSTTSEFFRIKEMCLGRESSIAECGGIEERDSCPRCRGGWVRCSPACTDREIRLVNGSTPNEGRVEVLVNGHWGTVCNNSLEGLAGAVCSQLGFSPKDARVVTSFGPGILPITTCTVLNGSSLKCTELADASCDHFMDLGVVCRTYEQLYNELQDEYSSTDPPLTPPRRPSVTRPSTTEGGQTGETGERVEGCVSTQVLGGVVGVLVTVLVVLVIGWSLSCVALVKRNSHTRKQKQPSQPNNDNTERQLDNPVYDSNMETHNYSSSGPAYELVDTNKGVGHNYSVPEQCGKRISKLAKTTTEDEEHYYHVLESGESEGVTGRGGDYEVLVSGQTHSRVLLCEEQYSTLQH